MFGIQIFLKMLQILVLKIIVVLYSMVSSLFCSLLLPKKKKINSKFISIIAPRFVPSQTSFGIKEMGSGNNIVIKGTKMG